MFVVRTFNPCVPHKLLYTLLSIVLFENKKGKTQLSNISFVAVQKGQGGPIIFLDVLHSIAVLCARYIRRGTYCQVKVDAITFVVRAGSAWRHPNHTLIWNKTSMMFLMSWSRASE